MSSSPNVVVEPPRAGAIALVCDSPHSGTAYPPDFGFAVALDDLRQCEDTGVEALWGGVPDVGGTLVHARFPRSYIDPNRACDDIDVSLFDEPWPGEPRPSERCLRLGNGLVYRKTNTLTEIYSRKLGVHEVQRRIHNCWTPYRRALSEALRVARASFGQVWHLNLHSMPSNAYERLGRTSATPLADVVIGDLHGRSCSATFTRCVYDAFSSEGLRVAINDPYAGQDLIRSHGEPDGGCHSLQIELNRKLYLDERTREPNASFAKTQAAVNRVLHTIAEHIGAELPHPPTRMPTGETT